MEESQSTFSKFRSFIVQCKRVLRVTRKPSMYEFKNIVKITGLGMIIIGLIGFVILLGKQLFF